MGAARVETCGRAGAGSGDPRTAGEAPGTQGAYLQECLAEARRRDGKVMGGDGAPRTERSGDEALRRGTMGNHQRDVDATILWARLPPAGECSSWQGHFRERLEQEHCRVVGEMDRVRRSIWLANRRTQMRKVMRLARELDGLLARKLELARRLGVEPGKPEPQIDAD